MRSILHASRRDLLVSAGLTGAVAGMGLPIPALAASSSKRRFLFVFAKGGWDQTWCFAPVFGSDTVDMPEDGEAAEVNNIPFVDSASRPIVRSFLERWGPQTAFVNGIEIPGIAHDSCTRLICTGSLVDGTDDWPSILAGNAEDDPILPLVHLSGPSYAARYVTSVVRVGSKGQLVELLDGSALAGSDIAVVPPTAFAEERMDARVAALVSKRAAAAGRGWEKRLFDGAIEAEERLARMKTLGFASSVSEVSSFQERVDLVLDYLQRGDSRVAMVAYEAWMGVFNGWDTHSENTLQGPHYDELFTVLSAAVARAAAEPGPEGGSLLDELVICVFSEMGRFPKINNELGKDHWTWTSAMLIGSGVRGGQAVGGYDQDCKGRNVDLASGEVTDSGTPLLASNLGATLLALGDVDPGEFVNEISPIEALID